MMFFQFGSCAYSGSGDACLEMMFFQFGSCVYTGSGDACLDMMFFLFGSCAYSGSGDACLEITETIGQDLYVYKLESYINRSKVSIFSCSLAKLVNIKKWTHTIRIR
jgi:hypothetical protein